MRSTESAIKTTTTEAEAVGAVAAVKCKTMTGSSRQCNFGIKWCILLLYIWSENWEHLKLYCRWVIRKIIFPSFLFHHVKSFFFLDMRLTSRQHNSSAYTQTNHKRKIELKCIPYPVQWQLISIRSILLSIFQLEAIDAWIIIIKKLDCVCVCLHVICTTIPFHWWEWNEVQTHRLSIVQIVCITHGSVKFANGINRQTHIHTDTSGSKSYMPRHFLIF